MDDLFAAVKDAASALSSNWNFVVNDMLRAAARLRARRGEHAGAAELLDAIPDTEKRVAASADVAMILARAGLTEQARSAFAFAEAGGETSLTSDNTADIASSMGGACDALGDRAAAEAWFARAREAIAGDGNAWSGRLKVIWALTECGRVDEARALWMSAKAGRSMPNSRDCEPWLLYLVSTGRLDLAEEFLDAWVPARSMSRPSSLITPLVELGRPDLLRKWLDGCWYIEPERYERAQAVADGAPSRTLPPTPTEEDVAALAEAHAELLKTPRARRQMPTVDLIRNAASRGHLSAVLDLLGALPADDFNDRARPRSPRCGSSPRATTRPRGEWCFGVSAGFRAGACRWAAQDSCQQVTEVLLIGAGQFEEGAGQRVGAGPQLPAFLLAGFGEHHVLDAAVARGGPARHQAAAFEAVDDAGDVRRLAGQPFRQPTHRGGAGQVGQDERLGRGKAEVRRGGVELRAQACGDLEGQAAQLGHDGVRVGIPAGVRGGIGAHGVSITAA